MATGQIGGPRRHAPQRRAPSAPAADELIAGIAIPFAEAVSKLLGPKVEVVVHSLRTETVAHICNPLSKREVGDPSYMTEVDFLDDDAVLGPFERLNWDGRVIRSISAVLRAGDGLPGERVGLGRGKGRRGRARGVPRGSDADVGVDADGVGAS